VFDLNLTLGISIQVIDGNEIRMTELTIKKSLNKEYLLLGVLEHCYGDRPIR